MSSSDHAATEPPSDGRRRRGARRRAAIVEATLDVIEHEGVAGVTHRRVAERAGVPASSVTYYFASLDDLLVAALTTAADTYARYFEDLTADGLDPLEAVATLTVEAAAPGPGRARAIAERELTLQAARRPPLRPIAQHWRNLVAGVARQYSSDPMAVQATVDLADGLCARILLDEQPLSVDEVHAILRRSLLRDP